MAELTRIANLPNLQTGKVAPEIVRLCGVLRLRGVSLAASRSQPWFLVFDRADFREDLVRFALA